MSNDDHNLAAPLLYCEHCFVLASSHSQVCSAESKAGIEPEKVSESYSMQEQALAKQSGKLARRADATLIHRYSSEPRSQSASGRTAGSDTWAVQFLSTSGGAVE